MSNVTERLRYYDGEYLRAFDFEAEQAYHLEMRRRLNRSLHLRGIAAGLFLEEDEDSVASDPLFHISPGMAIDGSGREILLSAPRNLDEAALTKKGLKPQPYALWLVYKEKAERPAAPGYQTCDPTDSSTRWREGYDLVFLDVGISHADGVQLGIVQLDTGPKGLIVKKVENVSRAYVGINAAQIVHPILVDPIDPATLAALAIPLLKPPDPVVKSVPPVGWIDVHPSLAARQDVLVAGNAVFGEDFDKSVALPATPPVNGNVKIDGTLYLRRPPQILVGNAFKTLIELVQAEVAKLVLPDFKSDVVDIAADTTGGKTHTFGQTDVTFTSTKVLNPAGGKHFVPTIVGIEFDKKDATPNWWTTSGANMITITSTPFTADGAGNYKVTLRWELNGNVSFTGQGLLKKVQIHYLAVLVP